MEGPAGTGPLIQRDYWAVIEGSRARPQEIMDGVAARFEDFAPRELAEFRRRSHSLRVGDEMDVRIRMTGTHRVRMAHRDPNSFTLETLPGHPEAGRITFGAYPNERGDVIFHIRSRARSGSARHFVGFVTVGEAMQTETWTEFVNRVALTYGRGVLAFIHAERRVLREDAEDGAERVGPTYRARGN